MFWGKVYSRCPILELTLTDVGDMPGGSLALQVSGIGDEINDFLDDTIAFASFAWSKTDPKGSHGTFESIVESDAMATMGMDAPATTTEMLGSSKSETGTSYYVGVNMPCPIVEDARIGLEYNPVVNIGEALTMERIL